MSSIRFEKCDCGGPNPHGYFYVDGEKAEIPTMSLEMGRAKILALSQAKELTAEEVANVASELQAAGLQDSADEDERKMVAMAAQAEEMGIPFSLLLVLAGVR